LITATRKTILVWISSALVVACSNDEPNDRNGASDDPDGNGKPTCQSFVSLLVDCGVITGTRLAGCDDGQPLLPCVTACVESASCEEIEAAYCYLDVNTFADCVMACDAAEPGPEFLCNNGVPIQASWRCDGVSDCPNGEDEACPDGEFVCDSDLRIPAGWQCDGVDDCPAGEDELDCSGRTITCGDGSSVPASRECDGASDCPDGEDELDCARLTCP
jgi:hypothetical protein